MRHLLKDRFLIRAGLVALLSLFFLGGCSSPPDEQAINNHIDQIITGLNDKDTSDVLEPVSQDFQGSHNLTRDGARRMMALYFLRHKSIDIVLTRRENIIQGDRATTEGTAVLAGRSQLLPETGRLVRFTAQWLKTDGEWQLYQLEWQ